MRDKKPLPPTIKPTAAAARAATAGVATAHHTTTEVFQGPIPHPDIMAGLDKVVPGAARELLDMAKAEAIHQNEMVSLTTKANISAQQKQLEIAEYQGKAVFRSDTIGQIAGVIVSLACIAASAYLAVSGKEWVAAVLAGIPTAAVIQAFFAKRKADSK